MHVIFVEPAFPYNQQKFPRALKAAGARVTGIGEVSHEGLPGSVRDHLDEYVQIKSVVHEASLLEAVQMIQRKGPWVDRLEATVEAHILPTAKVREACGIPGTSVETAFLCRDKPAMKEALRNAGIPCAQSTGTDDPEAVRAFAAKVGYPLIIKPRDGAGAAGTYKVTSGGELETAITESGLAHGASVAVEEFIEGHEGFFDTITVRGRIVHHFVTHYYPGVLEAMRSRWISPQFIATNRTDADGYDDLKGMGEKVIRALGISTSATHMEWFFGPKGLKFSEIGCRPPGVGAWDLYCAANDLDVYKEWALAVVHGQRGDRASRRFSAGLVNLRPEGDGRIRGYDGLQILDRFSEWLIDHHLPPAGSPTQPVEAGYMANAWVRLRHPDYDELRSMLDQVGQTLKVRVG